MNNQDQTTNPNAIEPNSNKGNESRTEPETRTLKTYEITVAVISRTTETHIIQAYDFEDAQDIADDYNNADFLIDGRTSEVIEIEEIAEIADAEPAFIWNKEIIFLLTQDVYDSDENIMLEKFSPVKITEELKPIEVYNEVYCEGHARLFLIENLTQTKHTAVMQSALMTIDEAKALLGDIRKNDLNMTAIRNQTLNYLNNLIK